MSMRAKLVSSGFVSLGVLVAVPAWAQIGAGPGAPPTVEPESR